MIRTSYRALIASVIGLGVIEIDWKIHAQRVNSLLDPKKGGLHLRDTRLRALIPFRAGESA